MAAEEGSALSGGRENGMADINGVALLVVVGEPFTDDQRELILERLTKSLCGFQSSVDGFDLNNELQAIATAAPTGEDGRDGEVIVQHSTGVLNAVILVNPQIQTIISQLRQFLLLPSHHRIIIYSGQVIQGCGSWILQDDLLTFASFESVCKEVDVQNALKQNGGVLDLHLIDEGDWSAAHIMKRNICKDLQININPSEVIHDFNGILQFTAYLSYFVKVKSCKQLLQSSDVVGNIRFNRPTLYVFPGCQGDSALFGISGFNLLVNAGYSKKACFWGFTRHLDRIDALLLTHLGADNIFGVSSVFERKAIENVHPEIGHIYFNAVEKMKHSPNGDIQPENGGSHKPASFVVSIAEQANRLVENMKFTGQAPHPCIGHIQGNVLQPLNLYHKVGHGTLDMYVLNPVQDSKELKDFLVQWNKGCHRFTSNKNGIPLPNQTSVCALLVWKPASPNESITRILFPGNAPQVKIFEGLDRLKTLDIFKQVTCSESSLHPAKAGRKAPSAGGAKSAKAVNNIRTSPMPRGSPVPSAKAEPKKAVGGAEKKATSKPASAAKSTSAASKPAKDAKNKKATAGSKEEKEKKTPSTASSASKAESPESGNAEVVLTPSNTPVEAEVLKTEVEQVAAEAAASLAKEAKTAETVPAKPEPTEVPSAAAEGQHDQASVTEPAQSVVSPEDVQPKINEVAEPGASDAATGDLLGDLSTSGDEKVDLMAQEQASPSAVAIADLNTEPPKEEAIPDKQHLVAEAEPAMAKEAEKVHDADEPLPAGEVATAAAAASVTEAVADETKGDTADNSEASQVSTETDTATVQSVEGLIESPEALPHPQQFDAVTFEAVAMNTSLGKGNAEEAANAGSESLLPEADQQQTEIKSQKAEQEPVQAKEDTKLDVQPDKVSISSEEDKELPTPEEFRAEAGFEHKKVSDAAAAPQEKPEEPAPAQTEQQEAATKNLADLGIYEDETLIQQCLEGADSKTLAELGLVDEGQAHRVDEAAPVSSEDKQDTEEVDADSLADAGAPGSLSGDQQTDSLEHLPSTAVEPPADVVAGVDPAPPCESSVPKAVQEPASTGEFVGMQLNTTTEHNPFNIADVSAEQPNVPDLLQPQVQQQERDSLEREDPESSFDPLKEWGQPVGLPAPDGAGAKEPAKKPDEQKKLSSTKTTAKTSSAGTKKPADSKKPQSADGKKPEGTAAQRKTMSAAASKTTRKPEAKGTNDAAPKKPSARDVASKRAATNLATRRGPPEKAASPKTERRTASARSAVGGRKTGAAATNKPSAPPAQKLAPVTPFCVDLSYIPAHGDSQYVDMNFFRRVRARYYVLSSLNPSTAMLNALLEAKQTWEDPNLEVTVVPTYDTDTLHHWMGLNRDQLSQLKIDFAPSASRCTIQLQDHEASCAAYRLEF